MSLGLNEHPWREISWSNSVEKKRENAVCAYSAQVALPHCVLLDESVLIVLVKIYFGKSQLNNLKIVMFQGAAIVILVLLYQIF